MLILLKFENGLSFAEALNVSLTGIVVVMIMLAVLAVLVILLSKGIRLIESKAEKDKKKKSTKSEKSEQRKPSGTPLASNRSKGDLELIGTDEKTAAVIMAIVSDESKIPLNRLQFNYIKLIERNEGKENEV